MVIIRSTKFKLRPIKKGDEGSLIKNINNKKIARNNLKIPYPYTLKDARSEIKHNLKSRRKKKKTEINFVIDMNGEVIGNIGIAKIENHKAELRYWLGEKYWGQGIMTEAVKLVTKHAFTKLGLRRLYAHVFSFNKASARVLKRAGYKYEGTLRKNSLKENRLIDNLLFAKVR